MCPPLHRFILVESKEVMEHLQKDQEETKEKVKGLEVTTTHSYQP